MKKAVLVVVALSVALLSKAQNKLFTARLAKPCTTDFTFAADTSAKNNFKIAGLDSLFKPVPDELFEFRLYEMGLSVQSQAAFIMTFTKNKTWEIRYFNHYDDEGNLTKNLRERHVGTTYADNLWCMLTQLEVLTLPDHNRLRPQMIHLELDTANLPYSLERRTEMTDGMYYHYSLRTQGRQRSYGYGNPNASLKQYANVRELYNASAIIAVIKKYVNRPAVVY
ncbi:hypothetical protein ABDD95_11025 [Mucilaginibacter sp. PAMB04274]|uniref:hypothetical protein n=1 Tax=Mucilaginibacter sp. PAMB04274 TaxID=3138568 RepID=UPI0031F64499